MGDAPEGGCADIDVGLRLDLAGAVDDGDEFLADDFAGGDLSDVGLAVKNAADDDACKDQDDHDNYNNLFSAHCCFLRPPRTAGRTLGMLPSKTYGDEGACVPYSFPEIGLSFSRRVMRSIICFFGR